MAVAIQIPDNHAGRAHFCIEELSLPVHPGSVRSVIHTEAGARSAVARHNFIITVAVQVCAGKGVPIVETRIDHAPVPQLARFAFQIDHHLVAVPGFDGGKVALPAHLPHQADTKRLDDAAVLLKARDSLIGVLSDANAVKIAGQIAAAKGTAIDLPAEVPMFDFVENVGVHFDLGEGERKILKEEVARELSRGQTGGRLTPFVISQGVTATAKRIGAAEGGNGTAFDRKVDLEHVGFEIIEDPLADLLKAGLTGRQQKARRN